MKRKLRLSLVIIISLNLFNGLVAWSAVTDSVFVNRVVSIIGVGDIMLGSTFPGPGILPPHDNPLLILGDLVDTLASADITFGNLEGSFLDHGEPAKKCKDTTICYLFRMPERYANTLAVAGFDMLSLANNHFGDFGNPARIRTMKLLDSLDIKYAGIIEKPYSIFERIRLFMAFVLLRLMPVP